MTRQLLHWRAIKEKGRRNVGGNPPSQSVQMSPATSPHTTHPETIVTLHLQASFHALDTVGRAGELEEGSPGGGGGGESALYCVFGLLGLDQVPPQSSQETGSRALLLFAGAREHKSHPRFSHPRILRLLLQRFPSRGGGNVMSEPSGSPLLRVFENLRRRSTNDLDDLVLTLLPLHCPIAGVPEAAARFVPCTLHLAPCACHMQEGSWGPHAEVCWGFGA
ncbi:hypothetical protein BGZ57DRAFT_307775 [Hyaloscypha finlandica]|nr:hypothetical protein BGZ57DRAFT_307775 [Hyaloscypha finlandica]